MAASLMTGPQVSMAGPFANEDFDRLVPADKKLNRDWVRSLFERGEPREFGGEELQFIGLPIGGLCAGQLYLGGDGRLWLWDIFNQWEKTGGAGYAHPPHPHSPLHQEFVLRLGDREVPLSADGFSKIRFRGEYPMGHVFYEDDACPLSVHLEAFSPFVPLKADDSSFPSTVCRFSVMNRSAQRASATLVGELQNGVCLYSPWAPLQLRNRISHHQGFTYLDCNSDSIATRPARISVFEDWQDNWKNRWSVGQTQYQRKAHPALLSEAFRVTKQFLNFVFLPGGKEEVIAVQVLSGNRTVREETRIRAETGQHQSMDLFHLLGEEVRLAIVAEEGQTPSAAGISPLELSDQPPGGGSLDTLSDYGGMGMALLGDPADLVGGEGVAPLGETLTGKLGRELSLAPGESATVTFVISWYFPNLHLGYHGRVAQFYPAFDFPGGQGQVNRYYGSLFSSAKDATAQLIDRFDELYDATTTWRDTWYDSTLPYWFLDRVLNSVSALATNTCLRFEDGRFWGWEGVDCCPGTCTHVYGYTQSIGRLFPELERGLRERIDYGQALDPSGCISFRGGPLPQEADNGWAIDGQCMVILRTLREHQMTVDSSFLVRIWPQVTVALAALMTRDMNSDGILDGPQFNTLDSAWYGEIAWTSGLYNAALCAGERMALELGDTRFARRCRRLLDRGKTRLNRDLFNGEYYANHVDPKHLDSVNSGSGCHIDQMLGQGWAFQVGLGEEFSGAETKKALKSLWRYNFSPDVAVYRKEYKQGRWFAMAGDAGLLMCTFPRSDWSFEQSSGKVKGKAFTGYLNECMAGFEYQAASHMIWEGMVEEGLVVTRAIHDRYDGAVRNPFNEIECGDHYARNMSSYGVYTAVSGFQYHGPQGRLAFNPRISPEAFKAAFTAAEGWGSFSQTITTKSLRAEIELKHGRLKLNVLELVAPDGGSYSELTASVDGKSVEAEFTGAGRTFSVRFASILVLNRGHSLIVTLS